MTTLDLHRSDYSETSSEPLLVSTREREIVQYVESAFERAKKERQQFEKVWYTNLAFYFGRQYIQWTSTATGQRLVEPKAPAWRVRLISNKIKPIVRAELAKITKEKPQAYVIPASTEDEDLLAARAGEGINEHLFRTLHMNKMLRRASFWTVTCGNGFIKDWYDPFKEADGTVGAVQVEPLSPFHVYVSDVQEEEIENQEMVIHVLAKSKEFIETKYKKNVMPDTKAGGGLESQFLQAVGITSQPRDAVAVKEGWFRPCKKFPKGAQVTWANGVLLSYRESLLYEHGEFPFTKFDHVPTGRFYTDSVITDLVPLQKEYNRTRSQIIESKNRMSKPQLLAARGSIDVNKVTSEPGLVILYTPGIAPPTPLPLQSIPSYVVEELDRTQRDMDDISSQHEVAKGRTPPGVTAATAISYLQEEDDTKLSYTITSLEEGVERLGRHFLSHVSQFWDAERAVKVMGMNDAFETQQLSKADIRGNTDYKIQTDSAIPRSRAAKQALLMELGKMGWIPPDRALKYMDMAETGKMHEEMQIDTRQVQRENIRMSEGEGVEMTEPEPQMDEMGMPQMDEMGQPMMSEPQPFAKVNTYDNHQVHILEHNNFRKTQKYEQLDPQLQQVFETHVQMHQQLLAQERGIMIPPGMKAPEIPGEGGPGTPDSPPSGGQDQFSGGQEGLSGRGATNAPPGPAPSPEVG